MLAILFNIYLVFISLVALGMLFLASRGYKQENPKGRYSPKTLVIVPCKGTDLTLEENLVAISKQKYHNYDMVCVVDDTKDKSLVTIKKLKLNYIISKSRCGYCSGKVRAIASAVESLQKYSVYVIADSDILPEPHWLANLVAPLADPKVGLSTGYPFFNPISGFWSKVKSAWGLVGEGLMESKVTVFGWGGSLAFRRDLLDSSGMSLFKESISDDIALTNISKNRSLKIFYAKNAKLKVNVKEDFREFAEWANRQTTLSTMGNSQVFYFGVIFYFAQILLLLSGLILGIFYSLIFLLLLLPIILGTIKGYHRLRSKYAEFFLISPTLPFIYLSNLLIAKSMKQIRWRGNTYLLKRH